jgi:hypothetical protein
MVASASPARARPSSDSSRVLSYNSVRELAAQPHVAHLPDRVRDAYEAEVTDGYRHSPRRDDGSLFDHPCGAARAVGARGAMMPLIIMADTGAEAAIGQGPSANGWQDTGAEGGKGP